MTEHHAGNNDVRYTADHLWLRPTGDGLTLGITERIAETLTLVNAVDLPELGPLETNAELALIDAQKVAWALSAPFALHVTEVNDRLRTNPILVRTDPRGDGWLIRCTLDHPGDWATLLDETSYQAHVQREREAIENAPRNPDSIT
ncbi:glycine cleavage system protein H [Amycolatopsis taiwanensis]|uniref:Glycine cleavage system H protein n=1 Tax=Amycolatopsis taiwanensis TaxID=342230 RepID=A0A9W6RBB3_9PSEU|nr:glycine cleavage system protein H [Amycolatopsis taiwanensis]GLY70967.1 glycine cleavage system H protein [Amycolatopsis taiwanensis]